MRACTHTYDVVPAGRAILALLLDARSRGDCFWGAPGAVATAVAQGPENHAFYDVFSRPASKKLSFVARSPIRYARYRVFVVILATWTRQNPRFNAMNPRKLRVLRCFLAPIAKNHVFSRVFGNHGCGKRVKRHGFLRSGVFFVNPSN